MTDDGMSLGAALACAGRKAPRAVKHRVAQVIVRDPAAFQAFRVERWDGTLLAECATLPQLTAYLRAQHVAIKGGWEVYQEG